MQPVISHRILFHEEQKFTQRWIWFLIIPLALFELLFFGFLIYKQLVLGEPVGGKPMPNEVLVFFGPIMIFFGVGLVWLFYALKLTTEVHADGIFIRFYPFMKKKILFSEIKHYEARTYRPILEYGGWGIRWGWKGRAYNVSGNRGVQLVLTNNKRILIGSQKPEEFVRAILKGKQA